MTSTAWFCESLANERPFGGEADDAPMPIECERGDHREGADAPQIHNERNGEFMVAIGVNFYARHPKGDMPTTNNMVYGIEWNHGIYYSQTPSTIDLERLEISTEK